MKIIAWEDRHHRSHGKDASAVADNQRRLWSEFISWTNAPNFDYELSGSRMLGQDIRRFVDRKGLQMISEILRVQLDEGELPQDMDRHYLHSHRLLLKSLSDGLGIHERQ